MPTKQEKIALAELKEEMDVYMLQKVAVATKFPQKTFLNIQDYFSCMRATHTEKSNVYYLNVMDAIADNKDTLISMLHDLHKQFIAEQNCQYLVVEGDAKIYEVLQSLKNEYGDELEWVIPFPGDWHMLMNFQSALMKPYFDAGLKSLTETCGYAVASIRQCSQFKRTHNFIMEAWEAVYRTMLTKFIQSSDCKSSNVLDDVITSLQSVQGDTQSELHLNLRKSIGGLMVKIPRFSDNFDGFIQKMSERDETWKFWIQFVFKDALAYVGLFLAIRSGDWYLRTGCAKLMAPIFTVFDHPTYQKLISNHIADLLDLPESTMLMLSQGAFVVNIGGREWHSVAIDEAHEMLVNKQCKNSITKPSEDYINRVAKYITHRTKSFEVLKQELFPPSFRTTQNICSVYSSKHLDEKNEMNIQAQMNALSEVSFFEITNCGLINCFTGNKATEQNHHDLLNFRKIGEDEYKMRISYFVLRQPSVKAPNRKRALQMFSVKIVKTKRVSQLERDKKLLISAMKNKIHFSQKVGKPIERPDEQLFEYPLSISDSNGDPLKGQKSNFTKTLEARYKKALPPIVAPYLPQGWTPQCSILEGMFLINSLPLPNHLTLMDYGNFLLKRYIVSQFKKGSSQVHVVFDNPGRLKNTPKYFEQKKRDMKATIAANHTCATFTDNTKVLHKKWRENYLHCRVCKRNL